MRWFRANAERYGVDPSKIIIGGYSAGGADSFLATFNCAFADSDDNSNPSNLGFSSCSQAELAWGPSTAQAGIGFIVPGSPPLIEFWGELDPGYTGVTAGFLQLYADLAGIPNELYMYPGAEHYKNLWTDANIRDMTQKASTFIYYNVLN